MIIESILNVIITLFTSMLSFVNIPQISNEDINSIYSFLDTIIYSGSSLIALFLPFEFVRNLLVIIVVIEIAIPVYHFVMWVLKKIPMLNIK